MDLTTTNWLLGVIAVASAVQMLAITGAAIAGLRMYRQINATLEDLEARHIAPMRQKVDGILADVHAITARVSEQTERVDHAISGTIERVDETKERVKHSVREQVWRATGVIRGIRAVIAALLTTEPPAEARGRV
jgi:hypothetical protein